MTPVLVTTPANDALASAKLLSGESASDAVHREDAQAQTITTLSTEQGEPLADPDLPTANRSAWWQWVAPRDGVFTFTAVDDNGYSNSSEGTLIAGEVCRAADSPISIASQNSNAATRSHWARRK
ncbi:MAG: hypothetical protein R3F19_25585 [Verrucomicrobiales bacterium]